MHKCQIRYFNEQSVILTGKSISGIILANQGHIQGQFQGQNAKI